MVSPLHPATAFLPRTFDWWDNAPAHLSMQEKYEHGFAGCFADPAGDERFERMILAKGGTLDGEAIAHQARLYGSAVGQLVPTFRVTEHLLPGCWPGAAQERGDCVSHSTKNAALVTMCCDIASGKPDEKTGQVEGLPEIDPEGIREGALSTETFYWYRGYNGDGWHCGTAANVAVSKSGLMPRNNYPELGIDLRNYSGSLAGKYGSKEPPENIQAEGRKHLLHTATKLRGSEPDSWRDYLANGYGLTTCGGEGWSSSRDANGFSERRGSWAHAMAMIGYDDRDVVKKEYGEPLVLILNSWGKWNGGGRRILGTDIDIPEGSFWAKVSSCKNREIIAFAGANGFQARKLPNFGTTY